jgi:hypothetical protein
MDRCNGVKKLRGGEGFDRPEAAITGSPGQACIHSVNLMMLTVVFGDAGGSWEGASFWRQQQPGFPDEGAQLHPQQHDAGLAHAAGFSRSRNALA